jgi:hypothetical protein
VSASRPPSDPNKIPDEASNEDIVIRRWPVFVLIVALLGTATLVYRTRSRHDTALLQQQAAELSQNAAVVGNEVAAEPPVVEQRVPAGNFVVALEKLGLTNAEAAGASAAAQQTFNLRQVRAGNSIRWGAPWKGRCAKSITRSMAKEC